MSQYCSGDPIQRIVDNRKISLLDPQQRRVYKHRSGNNSLQDRHTTTQSVEAKFLQHNISSNNAVNNNVRVSVPIKTGTTTSNGLGMQATRNDDWINEFSSMKVRDPLEFSDSYKSLYKQYEMGNHSRSQQTIGHMNTIPITPRLTRITSNANSIQSEMAIQREFDILEKEQSEEEKEVRQKEQLEFQESAQNFVNICEVSDSKEKLKQSKFFKLMQKVGNGTATVQETSPDNFKIE